MTEHKRSEQTEVNLSSSSAGCSLSTLGFQQWSTFKTLCRVFITHWISAEPRPPSQFSFHHNETRKRKLPSVSAPQIKSQRIVSDSVLEGKERNETQAWIWNQNSCFCANKYSRQETNQSVLSRKVGKTRNDGCLTHNLLKPSVCLQRSDQETEERRFIPVVWLIQRSCSTVPSSGHSRDVWCYVIPRAEGKWARTRCWTIGTQPKSAEMWTHRKWTSGLEMNPQSLHCLTRSAPNLHGLTENASKSESLWGRHWDWPTFPLTLKTCFLHHVFTTCCKILNAPPTHKLTTRWWCLCLCFL